MSGFDLGSNFLSFKVSDLEGLAREKDRNKDPKEALKGLNPVSAADKTDFNTSVILGKLEGSKFKFKEGADGWGQWSLTYLDKTLTFAIALFAYQDTLDKEGIDKEKDSSKIKQVEVPEHIKQQSMARSKGMYAVLGKSQ